MKYISSLLLLAMFLGYQLSLEAQACMNDTTFSDVVFLVDNSGSIDDAEYNQLEAIILATLNRLEVDCPQSRRGVVHYGGAFGTETIIEYPVSGSSSIMNVNRQYCTTRLGSDPNVCSGGAGGDDLNNAIGDIMFFIDNGSLQLDTSNHFNLVILTDAFGLSSTCGFPACSVILPTTNIDRLKRDYNADVTVVGISSQAQADVLSIYASPGGEYNDVNPNETFCGNSFDGCVGDRKYIPIEFFTNPATVAEQVKGYVACEMTIIEYIQVDAGATQSICGDRGESAVLTATPVAGTAPFTYAWSNNAGTGQSVTVTPFADRTYTVTMTDANNCQVTDTVQVEVLTCGPDCSDDTIFTDIIVMVDNSGSITDQEFASFENIILTSLQGLRTRCPMSRRAVFHYGGAFGQETFIEYTLGEIPAISEIKRQFCLNRDSGGICPDGGDDLNFAMGELLQAFQDGSINRNPLNQLSIVVFTDAFDSQTCDSNPNCSAVLPTTNVDSLKTLFGASVTVVGISSQANPSSLAIVASPGGEFTNVALNPECANSVDGCELPRKYIPTEFTTPPQIVSAALNECVNCRAVIRSKSEVDAGADQVICGTLNETATIMALPIEGQAPFTYQWDNNQGSNPNITVRPIVTTTYTVTMTDANTCESIDTVVVTVVECNDCLAEAGTPLPSLESCLINGRASLPAERNNGVVIPTRYEEVFLLTNSDLTIIDYNIGARNFTVTEPGVYRVHTLIAEVSNRNSEDYFDLGDIERGSSNLFIITNCIIDHNICANFDYAGRVHIVLPPEDMMCMTLENTINLCSDGSDNDNDGLTDCDDPDCIGLINCQENTLLACNDLFDNDNDGLIDCNDPDCYNILRCFERGDDCNDGIDNDGDGLVDCADDSCQGSAPCIENTAHTCIDGIDNDNDGLIDCEEEVCQKFIVCAEASAEACQDGIDNDNDGIIDCADADCKQFLPEVCTPRENSQALCSDGIDNDADGLIDCADRDCGATQFTGGSSLSNFVSFTNATCPTNSNGTIDFDLPSGDLFVEYSINGGQSFVPTDSFINVPVGTYNISIRTLGSCEVMGTTITITGESCPEICNNGLDDDGDGFTDCDDDDCGPRRSVSAVLQDPSCPSRENGVIRLFYTNSNGGVSGLEYSIDNGSNYQLSPIFRNLNGGNYEIRVRSSEGCELTESITLSTISCAEVCNNGIDDDGDGLTDCEDSDCSFDFSDDNITVVNPSCPDRNDGTITVDSDVAVSYRLDDSAVQSSNQFTGLIPGNYTITIRNQSGCSAQTEVTVDSQPCLEICDNDLDDDGDGLIDCEDGDCGVDTSTFILNTEDGFCPDETNGALFLRTADNVEYSLDGQLFQSSSVFEGLERGSYTLTIKNTNGCVKTEGFIIDGPDNCTEICDNRIDDDGDGLIDCDDPDCFSFSEANIVITDVTCPVLNDGRIELTNSSQLEISFDGSPFSSTLVYEQLQRGTYIIVVRNGNNCSTEITADVGGPEECPEICDNSIDDDGDGLIDCEDGDCNDIAEPIVTVDNATCPTRENGRIEVVIMEELNYSLGGLVVPSNGVIENVEPGDYTLTVRNEIGCIRALFISVELDENSCVEVFNSNIDDDGDGQIDSNEVDCKTEDEFVFITTGACPDSLNGSITIIPTLDLSYRFSLSGSAYQTDPTFSGLVAGVYELAAQVDTKCDTILAVEVPLDTCRTSAAASGVEGVSINLKVMMEGAYSSETEKMRTDLYDGGYLPGQQPSTFFGSATPGGQPFNVAPWFYDGKEGIPTGPNGRFAYPPNTVDWVLISLRSDLSKQAELCRAGALVLSDGTIQFLTPMSLPAAEMMQYYVIVEHRNHLPVMSGTPVPLVDGQLNYDFTQHEGYRGVFGTSQRKINEDTYVMIAGNGELIEEISSDIDINVRDLTTWLQMNGANSSYYLQDYDLNGDINIKDRILWEQNNGLFSPIQTKD